MRTFNKLTKILSVGMMYWHDWQVAIKGLYHFTSTYFIQPGFNVEMYFDIFEEGVGLIGTGALSEW